MSTFEVLDVSVIHAVTTKSTVHHPKNLKVNSEPEAPSLHLDGLRETLENFSHDNWPVSWDLNPHPPEYKAGMLLSSEFVSFHYDNDVGIMINDLLTNTL
jgi:hypothetical protein